MTPTLTEAAKLARELLETFTEWSRQVAARTDVPRGIRSAGANLHDDGKRQLAALSAALAIQEALPAVGEPSEQKPMGVGYFKRGKRGLWEQVHPADWVLPGVIPLFDRPEASPEQAQQSVQAVPEGFVLVPREPTDAMMEAFEASSEDQPRTWEKAWAAMLAAAPTSPALGAAPPVQGEPRQVPQLTDEEESLFAGFTVKNGYTVAAPPAQAPAPSVPTQEPLTDAERKSLAWLNDLCKPHCYLSRLGPIRDWVEAVIRNEGAK